jgi:hypothetical protein
VKKKVHLGVYANEEDAARAVAAYVEHGTVPAAKAKSSKFRGVSWIKASKRWEAQITDKGKYSHLGHFNTEEEAALAYNAAARRLGKPSMG